MLALEKILTSNFYSNCQIFLTNGRIEFEKNSEAKEFLALYASFLVGEREDFENLEEMEKTFQLVEETLETKEKISSRDFLNNPEKNNYYIIRNNSCFILE